MFQTGPIDGRMCEVVTPQQYIQNQGMYQSNYTALNIEGFQYVYPIRNRTDTRPGAYISGPFYKIKEPEPDEVELYSRNNVTDFSNPKGIGDLIRKQNRVKDQERTILTNPDNIFQPPIRPDDSPAMQALKQATNMKNIDFDQYAGRFGSNFNNTKRLYNNPTISLNKLVYICDGIDVKVTVTLEDASPDVPNPMGGTVTMQLSATDVGGVDE